jgi:hypothetical protein
MLVAKNKLGLALILESHLAEIRHDAADTLLSKNGANATARVEKLEQSCYVCDRIEDSFSKMLAITRIERREIIFREVHNITFSPVYFILQSAFNSGS